MTVPENRPENCPPRQGPIRNHNCTAPRHKTPRTGPRPPYGVSAYGKSVNRPLSAVRRRASAWAETRKRFDGSLRRRSGITETGSGLTAGERRHRVANLSIGGRAASGRRPGVAIRNNGGRKAVCRRSEAAIRGAGYRTPANCQLPTGVGRVFDYRETWGSASEIFSGTARMTTWRWASESSP